MQLVLLHRNEPDGDLDWSVGSGISIRINIRRKLMLMLMSLLPSLAHKLLMLMFMLMLASQVRTGLLLFTTKFSSARQFKSLIELFFTLFFDESR